MKQIFLSCTFLFFLVTEVTGQYYVRKNPYKWSISLSWNAIQDSGQGLDNAFDIGNTWNYRLFPSQFTFTKNIRKAWNWEIQLTSNKYTEGKTINRFTDIESNFLAFDANVHYSFAQHDLRRQKLAWLEPFLFAGVGFTNRSGLEGIDFIPTLNGGGGFNIFFSKRLGIQAKFAGKYGITSELWSAEANYMSYSLGLVYRQVPKRYKVRVNNKKRHKWTHKKPRYRKSNKYKVL